MKTYKLHNKNRPNNIFFECLNFFFKPVIYEACLMLYWTLFQQYKKTPTTTNQNYTHWPLYPLMGQQCIVMQIWASWFGLCLTRMGKVIRMGRKCDCDFDHGMTVGARQAALCFSKTTDLQGFSYTTRNKTCWKERMARLIWATGRQL